jgi:hypothetical protein
MADGTSAKAYVHGYCEREARRLHDQASALATLLHSGVLYPPGSRVLEAGLMSREDWRRGIDALYRTAEADGTFNYTFFKATGTR